MPKSRHPGVEQSYLERADGDAERIEPTGDGNGVEFQRGLQHSALAKQWHDSVLDNQLQGTIPGAMARRSNENFPIVSPSE